MSEATGPLAYHLRQAAQALESAERQIHHDARADREALHRELVQAAACVGRVMALAGLDPP